MEEPQHKTQHEDRDSHIHLSASAACHVHHYLFSSTPHIIFPNQVSNLRGNKANKGGGGGGMEVSEIIRALGYFLGSLGLLGIAFLIVVNIISIFLYSLLIGM